MTSRDRNNVYVAMFRLTWFIIPRVIQLSSFWRAKKVIYPGYGGKPSSLEQPSP